MTYSTSGNLLRLGNKLLVPWHGKFDQSLTTLKGANRYTINCLVTTGYFRVQELTTTVPPHDRSVEQTGDTGQHSFPLDRSLDWRQTSGSGTPKGERL
jgi:hypothetical protein